MKILAIALTVLCLVGCNEEIKIENGQLKKRIQDLQERCIAEKSELSKQIKDIEFNASASTQEYQLKVKTLEASIDSYKIKISNLKSDINKKDRDNNNLKIELNAIKQLFSEYKLKQAEAEKIKLTNQKGNLRGVVSYYFNKNFGFKPDVGSNIYIWKTGLYPEFNKQVLIDYTEKNRTLTKGELSELRSLLVSIWKSEDCFNVGVDASGSFKKQLAPGKYYVVTRSANRDVSTDEMMSGSLFFDKINFNEIQIKANEETSISAKFYP